MSLADLRPAVENCSRQEFIDDLGKGEVADVTAAAEAVANWWGGTTAAGDTETRKAAEERKRLQEQVRQLEEEKRQLQERVKPQAPRDVAAEFGAMSSSERNGVMFRLVTDHLPTDDRERQQWAKDACGWIQLIYSKLAGPRENPWKWRQKVHRLIKLPPGIDAGKASTDEIGDTPITATEADLAGRAVEAE